MVICKQTFRKPAAGAAGGHRAGGAKIFGRFFVPKAEKSCKTGAPAPPQAAPACTSRAHKGETQCTRPSVDDLPRTASTQPVPAAEIQRSLASPELHAAQSACMLVLRLHLAATAMSDRTQASFRHRPRRQPSPMSRISTHPASIRTGAVHDGGCLLASAADNNLMRSAELEERRQPTLALRVRTRSPRGSEAPECRAAGATGRRARHSRGGIRFMAFVAAKVRAKTPKFSKLVCRIPEIGAAPKRNDSRPKPAELSPKPSSSRRELSNDTLTVE